MNVSRVTDGIHQLSVTVRDILFEGLWEIPKGVTVNSYIVKGKKTALVDGVCGWDGVPETLTAMLSELDIEVEDLDYLIINHMEPDHSGWMEDLRVVKPDFKIVCTKAAEQLLEAFYGYTENIIVVKDGDTLDLGDGRVLEFTTMPNVHWPDAMVTYDRKSRTLLSCDVFGSYGAIEGRQYDDQLTEEEIRMFEVEAIRYYANIISAFSGFVRRSVKKLYGVEIDIVAPGHGIVWREDPGKIINDYRQYMIYDTEVDRDEITLIYGSMYGMTSKAVDFVRGYLAAYPVKLNVHKVPETSWGQVLASAWTSKGMILAMPTYEFKMFPPMAAVLEELGRKKVQNRQAFRMGSYGWSGGAQKHLDAIMEDEKMNWQFVQPVEFKGAPTDEDFDAIEKSLSALLKGMGIVSDQRLLV